MPRETLPNSEIQRRLLEATDKLRKADFPKTSYFKIYSIRTNPKAYVIPFVKEISDLVKEKFLKDEAYFCRSDLVEDVSKIIYPPRNYDNIIKKLKDIIDKKDIAALLFASKICEQENKGSGEDREERRRLKEAFNQRGFTLYNWLRSDDVFPEEILPLLGSKDSFPSLEAFKLFFLNYFEDLIQFHPNRIFVATNMNPNYLTNEINQRVCFYPSRRLFVYSRSGRNQIAEKVINKKDIWFSNIQFKVKRKVYKLGASLAIKFELIRIGSLGREDRLEKRGTRLRVMGIQERRRLLKEKEEKYKQEGEMDRMKKILSLFKKK